MKNLILSLMLISTAFIGCGDKSTEEANVAPEPLYVGTWKLTETKSDTGNGVQPWIVAINNYSLVLKNDNTFSRNDFATCGAGTYAITTENSKTILTLNYSCNAGDTEHQFKTKYVLSNTNSAELILFNKACFEECGEKFKKQ